MVSNKELVECANCYVWDPDNQPSVQREFERDPNAYADRMLVTVETGMTLNYGSLSIPLHTDLLVCKPHQKQIESENE